MVATRWTLITTMWILAVVAPAACADDNDGAAALASAANELGVGIAGTDVTVTASPSPCAVLESCPDVARVDLPGRSDLSLDELAAIATSLGWDVDIIDARLIMLANNEGMSGSISLDSQSRVSLVVGED